VAVTVGVGEVVEVGVGDSASEVTWIVAGVGASRAGRCAGVAVGTTGFFVGPGLPPRPEKSGATAEWIPTLPAVSIKKAARNMPRTSVIGSSC
jgi:hypothetical protein